MPRVDLELQKIPAQTIADLRLSGTLDNCHRRSNAIPAFDRLHVVTDGLLKLHAESDSEYQALNTGVKIAQSINYLDAVRSGNKFPERASAEKIASGLILALVNKDTIEANINHAVARVEYQAFDTYMSFRRAAITHVEGDEDRLEVAMRGAAVMHCAMNDTQVVDAQNQQLVQAVPPMPQHTALRLV